MNGILLIDKPRGWTSFDAVHKVRHLVENAGLNSTGRKRFPVGHTGTLDPLATGLLVLLLGKATKHAPGLTKLDKTYDVEMRLGEVSTTGDDEGEKSAVSTLQPPRDEVTTALQHFEGDSLQTPPIFSAIKVNGQRAYKLARAGKAPELAARPIHINSIELLSYEYPVVHFVVDVSSGTYVRSLVEDLGKMLKTGAYMTALRRTRVGIYDIADAVSPDTLTPEQLQASLQEIEQEASE